MPQVEQQLYDRYQLKQKLGQDACRQTWLAIDTQSQPPERVVVKLLAFNPQMQWDESKLFEREAKVLQTLDHPRIPKYRNYFTIDQLPDSRFPWFGLVQSYIPGRSLQELLDQGQRFTQAQVEKIAIEALSLLIYLHELKPPVLHRDFKPSNLIWGEDDRLYLVDFGAVQDQAAMEGATFTVVGTYGYVPIEQFGGRAVPASDLYALGATLVHLLTGRSPADLPQQNGRIQFADSCSAEPALVNWINKLIEPNLADRFSSARDALAALNRRHTLSAPARSPKPSGSRIQFHKSADQLNIKIPSRGAQAFNFVYFMSAGIALLVHLMQFSNILRPLTAWGLMAVFVGSVALMVIGLLLPGLQCTQIRLDRRSLKITHSLFGVCYRQRHVSLRTINAISTGDDLQSLLHIAVSPDEIKQKAAQLCDRLVLIADNQILATNPLSKVERLWLHQEIEDWLQESQQLLRDQ